MHRKWDWEPGLVNRDDAYQNITALLNKQKPMKNTRLFNVFHLSDLSISCNNSCVVLVNVNNLITGLGMSFYMVKTWVFFMRWTQDFYMRKLFFSHLLELHFLKNPGRGGYIFDFLIPAKWKLSTNQR